MKRLEEEKVDQLLGIIKLHPAVAIMHFSDGSHLLSKKIFRLCQNNSYEYRLNCTTDISYEKMVQKYSGAEHITIKRLDLQMPRYMMPPKGYDYVFVTTEVADIEKSSFLAKTYPLIKNGGLIIIFVQKSDTIGHSVWIEYLQENYYVATNSLDLFSHYDLIISKKMHGWGG